MKETVDGLLSILHSLISSGPAWIESHSTTVDVLKWLAVAAIAWAAGAFRFVRAKLKRPKLEIDSISSRCILIPISHENSRQDNQISAALVRLEINNPTTDPIVVRDFSLQFTDQRRFAKAEYLQPTTLPCRVRHTVGTVKKLLNNWFSNFDEGPSSLTLTGLIEARNYQSGYALFVSATYGSWRPKIFGDSLRVNVRARLTTGETLTASAHVRICEDHEYFDSFAPGITSHLKEPQTWNIRASASP